MKARKDDDLIIVGLSVCITGALVVLALIIGWMIGGVR